MVPVSELPEAAQPGRQQPGRRSLLRSVAVPTEHGGWGLTLEPVLLGLIVSWSAAGVCLAVVAFLAFIARAPLKVLLVDLRRRRALRRTGVARTVLIVEIAVMVGLVVAAVALGASAFWAPLLVIAPLAGIELWFDMRSRSRRLAPELAGAVGMSGVVAVVALAGGSGGRLAVACWLVLAARSVPAIVSVRDVVGHLHGRPRHPRRVLGASLTAVAMASAAVAVDQRTTLGVVAVLISIATQEAMNLRPPPRAVVIGVRQTLFGLGVVAATAIGVLWT